jgi:hypothetical protein
MITKLTRKQEKMLSVYMKKWLKVVSKPIEKRKANLYIEKIYRKMGLGKPIIIYANSPLATVLIGSLFHQLGSQLGSQLHSQLDSQLSRQLDSQLHSQLHSQLYSQLGSQLYTQLDSQLDSQLRSQLYSQLGSQLRSQLDGQLGSQLGTQLDGQLYSQLSSQLYNQLGSQLDSQLDSQLRSQLYNQLGSQLDSQLHSQLRSQLHSQLHNQLRSQLRKIKENYYITTWWLVWSCYYDYGKYIGVKFEEEAFNLFLGFVTEIGFIIPYKNIAFISKKPIEIHFNGNLLHNDKGAAVLYLDSYSIWSLNGVRVTKEIVETSPDKLDPNLIITEKNAEVRREIVRKIGIERVCQKLKTKTIDKNNSYELLEIPIKEISRKPRYLKMKNPSIDTYHLEGVPSEIKTCQEAINWRTYGDINIEWNPSQLT